MSEIDYGPETPGYIGQDVNGHPVYDDPTDVPDDGLVTPVGARGIDDPRDSEPAPLEGWLESEFPTESQARGFASYAKSKGVEIVVNVIRPSYVVRRYDRVVIMAGEYVGRSGVLTGFDSPGYVVTLDGVAGSEDRGRGVHVAEDVVRPLNVGPVRWSVRRAY